MMTLRCPPELTIVIDEARANHIQKCEVVEDAPLNVWLEINGGEPVDCQSEKQCKINYQWMNRSKTLAYETQLQDILPKIRHMEHDVDSLYETILTSMTLAANNCLTRRTFSKFLKPYWTPVLKETHAELMQARHLWAMNGKPRDGEMYSWYKCHKSNFRRLIRKAAHEYESEEADRIETLNDIDQKSF